MCANNKHDKILKTINVSTKVPDELCSHLSCRLFVDAVFPMEKWSESLLISLRMIPRFFVSPRIILVVVNPQLLNIPEGRHVLDFFGSTYCGYLSSQQVEMMHVPSNLLNVVVKKTSKKWFIGWLSHPLEGLVTPVLWKFCCSISEKSIWLVLSTHIWTISASFTLSRGKRKNTFKNHYLKLCMGLFLEHIQMKFTNGPSQFRSTLMSHPMVIPVDY